MGVGRSFHPCESEDESARRLATLGARVCYKTISSCVEEVGCATHCGDEGVVGAWAERGAQGDVCPRIPVTRSALVDEESRRTEHLVSECEEKLGKWVVTLHLYARAVYDETAERTYGDAIVSPHFKQELPNRDVNRRGICTCEAELSRSTTP